MKKGAVVFFICLFLLSSLFFVSGLPTKEQAQAYYNCVTKTCNEWASADPDHRSFSFCDTNGRDAINSGTLTFDSNCKGQVNMISGNPEFNPPFRGIWAYQLASGQTLTQAQMANHELPPGGQWVNYPDAASALASMTTSSHFSIWDTTWEIATANKINIPSGNAIIFSDPSIAANLMGKSLATNTIATYLGNNRLFVQSPNTASLVLATTSTWAQSVKTKPADVITDEIIAYAVYGQTYDTFSWDACRKVDSWATCAWDQAACCVDDECDVLSISSDPSLGLTCTLTQLQALKAKHASVAEIQRVCFATTDIIKLSTISSNRAVA